MTADQNKPTQPHARTDPSTTQSGTVADVAHSSQHGVESSAQAPVASHASLHESHAPVGPVPASDVVKVAPEFSQASKKSTASDAKAEPVQVAKDVSTMDTASASTPKSEKSSATPNSSEGRRSMPSSPASNKPTQKSPTSSSTSLWVAGGTGVIAVILAAGLWWQNERFEAVSREVASRLQAADQQVSTLTRDVQAALSQNSSQSEQLTLLQRDLRTMRSEMTSMDQAWQTVNRTLDDRLLVSYLRRLLNLTQQLVLTGQVTGAISVLESSLEMIQGHHSPEQFATLTTALSADLERLRALPVVDVNELSQQLGRVVALVEKAPLLIPDRVSPSLASIKSEAIHTEPTPVSAPVDASTSASSAPWWQNWLESAQQTVGQVARVASREFSDLMQVRRADMPQTLLLSEEQAMLVRTNVRSMLLGAQLALMNRQPQIWSAELGAVSDMLRTYYDEQSPEVVSALKVLEMLRQAPVAIDVKPITESLSALAVVAQAVTVPATSGETH